MLLPLISLATSLFSGGGGNTAKKEEPKSEDSSQLSGKTGGNKDSFSAYRKGVKDGLKMRETV